MEDRWLKLEETVEVVENTWKRLGIECNASRCKSMSLVAPMKGATAQHHPATHLPCLGWEQTFLQRSNNLASLSTLVLELTFSIVFCFCGRLQHQVPTSSMLARAGSIEPAIIAAAKKLLLLQYYQLLSSRISVIAIMTMQ